MSDLVQGSIGGETSRRSLNAGNRTAASTIVHRWQSSWRIGVLKPDLPTVTEAVDQFFTERPSPISRPRQSRSAEGSSPASSSPSARIAGIGSWDI